MQANAQIAFCIQEVIVTPTSIDGGPLVIPFRAMFDGQPTGAEGDIVIDHQGFRDITRLCLRTLVFLSFWRTNRAYCYFF